MEHIYSFKDLRVWKKGIEIVKEAYLLSKILPNEELYGLVSQMRRAAVSIPANIAEGFRRKFNREQKRFLGIALGSCAELETHIIIAKELKYLNEDDTLIITELIDHSCGMLVNLIKSL
jgi:four helix bundle protein